MNNIMNRKKYLLIFNFLIPLFIAAMIYIGARPLSLKMFHWVSLLGGNEFLFIIRQNISQFNHNIPYLIIYNLPSALWIYSYTYIILILWGQERTSVYKKLWIISVPTLAIVPEFLQKVSLISGTFDLIDVFGNLLGILFACSIYKVSFKLKKL